MQISQYEKGRKREQQKSPSTMVDVQNEREWNAFFVTPENTTREWKKCNDYLEKIFVLNAKKRLKRKKNHTTHEQRDTTIENNTHNMWRPIEKWRSSYEFTDISFVLKDTDMDADNHHHQDRHQHSDKYEKNCCHIRKTFNLQKRCFKIPQTLLNLIKRLNRLKHITILLYHSDKSFYICPIERHHDDIIERIDSPKNFENTRILLDLHIENSILWNILYLIRACNGFFERNHKINHLLITRRVLIADKNRVIKFFDDQLSLYLCLLYQEKSDKEGEEKPRQYHDYSDGSKSCPRNMLPWCRENTREHGLTIP